MLISVRLFLFMLLIGLASGYLRAVQADPDGFQEWTADGKLTASATASEPDAKRIRVLFHYENGKKKCEGYLENDQRTGQWMWYHENGVAEIEGYYDNGMRTGRWVWYYPDNKKWAEGQFANNMFSGEWTWWHSNGNFWSQGSFKNGVLDGRWVNWYENGNKKMEGEYKDGKMHGRFYVWHSDGKQRDNYLAKGELKDSCGEWTIYHSNGKIAAKGMLQNGLRNGQWEFYHSNGVRSAEGAFNSGEAVGVWTTYYKNGNRRMRGGIEKLRQRYALETIPANATLNHWNDDVIDGKVFGTFSVISPSFQTPVTGKNPLVDASLYFLRPVKITYEYVD